LAEGVGLAANFKRLNAELLRKEIRSAVFPEASFATLAVSSSKGSEAIQQADAARHQ
jgi:hypothetical protein